MLLEDAGVDLRLELGQRDDLGASAEAGGHDHAHAVDVEEGQEAHQNLLVVS